MELRLTPEQSLLRDSAAKFIATAGPKVARGFRARFRASRRHVCAPRASWVGSASSFRPRGQGLGLGLTELALLLEQAGEGTSSVSRSGLLPSRPLRCHSGHIPCSRR